MQTITIDIPEEIVEQYPTIETIKRTMLEEFVANEYQQGHLSMRQGAKLLGLTYEAFMVNFLGSRKLSFINGTPEELAAEAQQEDAWLDDALRDRK